MTGGFNRNSHTYLTCNQCTRVTPHVETLRKYTAQGIEAVRYMRAVMCQPCVLAAIALNPEVDCLVPAKGEYHHLVRKPELHGDRPDVTGGPDLPFGNK